MSKTWKIRIPSKQGVKQFMIYNLGGAAFFVVGYGIFALLYGVFDLWWVFAKAIGDFCGWATNYLIQRHLVFHKEAKGQRERDILGKFTLISAVNLLIDYLIVGGLKLLGVSPFLGLWISSIFFTFWKYLWYKLWVFRVKTR